MRVTDLGATLLSVRVPDRAGTWENVLVGPDRPDRHPAAGAPGPDARAGATCGRVANRIGGAAYTINGLRHTLIANEGANQLHGGASGFDKRLWSVLHAAPDRVDLALVSDDGDEGHPGRLDAHASFSVTNGGLRIVYTATTSRPTHVNLVSHPYWNLSGEPSCALGHHLTVAASGFLPIDAAGVPTGEIASVTDTPFDFQFARPIGERIDADHPQIAAGDGYNHNLVLTTAGMHDTAAILLDPASGRRLTIATDQPGLQLYTGNALPEGGRRSAVCLETQAWPDAANQPDFPSTRLNPGDLYRSETLFRFDTA